MSPNPATRPLAITPGDPAGIGPEVAIRAAAEVGREGVAVVLLGPPAVWLEQAAILGLDAPVPLDVPTGAAALGSELASARGPSAEGGRVALEAIERAVAGCLAGEFAGMVTAPISKESMALAGSPFAGHTELLADRAGAGRFAMMLVREGPPAPLRVALLTLHVPLREVPGLITRERVLAIVSTVEEALRADWGIERPRLALLGLNPHAGDGGVIGSEERETLEPAIQAAVTAGAEVEGPFPADAFFGRAGWRRYDAVIACYHDQGLAPFKALSQGAGVNVTCGLPFVRTSPDHGTAFDIAGHGRADAGSMLEAIRLAARLAARRRGEG